ncbi:hypothetical protein ZIOFF_053597 [Zingiber officinale]|uniref:Uncharacterized protein n=1 Tax=Zingiber officinale TaxID=94328 RepID=A0A8J5FGX0_ZINOF|nr:hypothetical protein ZIOFF_053597 [Zingiber officinale]
MAMERAGRDIFLSPSFLRLLVGLPHVINGATAQVASVKHVHKEVAVVEHSERYGEALQQVVVCGGALGTTRTDSHSSDDRDYFPADFRFGAGSSAYQPPVVALLATCSQQQATLWLAGKHASHNVACCACKPSLHKKRETELLRRSQKDCNGFIPNNQCSFLWREDFTAYADVCFKEYGDRVKYWTTINEPNVYSIFGYDPAVFPPDHCSASLSSFYELNCSKGNSSVEPYVAAQNLLLSHASAQPPCTERNTKKYQPKQRGCIGITLFAFWYEPFTALPEDIAAAKRALDFLIDWFVDCMVDGRFLGEAEACGSFDFIGLNHYQMIFGVPLSLYQKTDALLRLERETYAICKLDEIEDNDCLAARRQIFAWILVVRLLFFRLLLWRLVGLPDRDDLRGLLGLAEGLHDEHGVDGADDGDRALLQVQRHRRDAVELGDDAHHAHLALLAHDAHLQHYFLQK